MTYQRYQVPLGKVKIIEALADCDDGVSFLHLFFKARRVGYPFRTRRFRKQLTQLQSENKIIMKVDKGDSPDKKTTIFKRE